MRNEQGVVMVFTFAILIVLVTIATGFLFMITTQTIGGSSGLTSSQAIWVSEGGIQQVLYQLKNDASFRNNPTSPVAGSLGTGSYSATVSKNSNVYTLSSTGTVDNFTRTIAQTATVLPAAYSYAIFGSTNANQLQLKNSVVISGNLYYDGPVLVDTGTSVINGLVYGTSVTGSGTYTAASGSPSPVPVYPTFDTSYYDGLITTAESTATSDWTLSGSSSYNLNGGTVYYKKVTIKDTATITGTGVIVATKDLTIKNSANISSGVTIITKKDITVENSAVVQSGGVLYGRNSAKLKDSANVTGSLLCPTSGKTTTVQDTAAFTGLIYANILKLRNSTTVTGSAVANSYTANKITDSVRVTYDSGSIPNPLPQGISLSATVTVSANKNWDES